MKRLVVFLDDCEVRHHKFRAVYRGHDIYHVRTARQAISAIEKLKPHEVWLDHDLGPGDGTGAEVVAWMLAHRPTIPGPVIIHSMNDAPAVKMYSDLLHAGYSTRRLPFEVWHADEAIRH